LFENAKIKMERENYFIGRMKEEKKFKNIMKWLSVGQSLLRRGNMSKCHTQP
jgi:hypothetical protein